MATVSVVIPFFNRRHTLSRALSSICQQTISPLEIIAVDDASNDGGAALVRETVPEVTLLQQPENKGVSAARNLGIMHASGDWIALLDSDDEWLPTKLEEQLTAVDQSPTYKIVHTDEVWIRNGKRVNAKMKHKKYGGHIFERCLPLCAISPSSVMIHRDVFSDVGLFDETLLACEDYDMWLRVCSRYPVCYIDHPLVKKYGGHSDQLSRQYWGMDRFRIVALEKILNSQHLSEQERKMVIATLIKKATIMLEGARKRSNQSMVKKCHVLLNKYQQGEL